MKDLTGGQLQSDLSSIDKFHKDNPEHNVLPTTPERVHDFSQECCEQCSVLSDAPDGHDTVCNYKKCSCHISLTEPNELGK